MRLVNFVTSGKYFLKIVLDDSNSDLNYIQKTKGCTSEKFSSDCLCIKCRKEVNWMKWNKNVDKASNTCECGEKQTIEIISCMMASDILFTIGED